MKRKYKLVIEQSSIVYKDGEEELVSDKSEVKFYNEESAVKALSLFCQFMWGTIREFDYHIYLEIESEYRVDRLEADTYDEDIGVLISAGVLSEECRDYSIDAQYEYEESLNLNNLD